MLTTADIDYVACMLCERACRTPELECREYERHDLRSPIHLTPITHPGGPLRQRLGRECMGMDLSSSGLRVLWRGGPPPERFVVRLLDTLDEPNNVEARRVWMKKVDLGRYEIGLEFCGVHPMTQEQEGPHLIDDSVVAEMTGAANQEKELAMDDIMDMSSFAS